MRTSESCDEAYSVENHKECLCHPPTPELHVWGIDHHRASTEVREQVYMDREKAASFVSASLEEEGFISVLPLCTCNRTELYMEVREGVSLHDAMQRAMKKVGIDPALFEGEYGFIYSGRDAVRHLYRVIAGLESMMLGETQITGQVKEAYRFAREAHTPGPIMLRAFQGAFRAGKRVRTQTRIDRGAVSVAFAAVELARKFFADLGDCTAMLVGAGETGTLAARHFLQQGIGGLRIINRSLEKAEKLVKNIEKGGPPLLKAMEFSHLAEGLSEVDIVLTATSSPAPVIFPEMVKAARKKRRGRPLFIVDIAVPRDVHPEIDSSGNIYVYGLDELGEIIKANLAARRNEILAAEKIIEHELTEFQRWVQDLELRPTVAQFRAYLEGLKERELNFVRKKSGNELASAVEKSLQGFIKNLLQRSVSQLKSSESTEERFRNLDTLRLLFELDRMDPGEDNQDCSSEARAS